MRDESRGQVLVKACLNGPRTRSEHAAIPILSAEIASDAKDTVEAGAGAVHFHPRAVDGKETLAAGPCGEAISSVRKLCASVPIGLSTAEWIERSLDRKLELIRRWDILPDFASVNFNEAGSDAVCALLLRRGIGVEAGIWSLEDARRLLGSRFGQSCLRILVEITEEEPSAAVNLANEIETYLNRSGVKTPRLHHGHRIATWAVLRSAVSMGVDVRVGLEDTTLLPDGTVAKNNRELVEVAVRLVRDYRWAPS